MKTIERIDKKAPVLPRKKRVAAYARVSMESERMQHSLSAQVSYYSALIQKNPEWEYAGVYADYGISGTGMKGRDEFKRMLADCEAGAIDIILTKSIQRFARNTVDLLNTIRHLKELGIEVRFEKENIHSLSGDGELMLTILASFAQEESRSISENCKWGIRKRYERGETGGCKIYGYRTKDGNLVIHEEEAAVVRRIFQMFLDGDSCYSIAQKLNAEGVPSYHRKRFNGEVIGVMIRQEKYTGCTLAQKFYAENHITHKLTKNKGELPIAQIARDLTAAEQEIKDELEGKTVEAAENQAKEDAVKSFQVVSGDMFSRVHEPVIRITTKGITFNKSCVSKLPGAENVELLFNPVERMMVIRPCRPDHPNAIPWDAKYKSAAPLCKVLYDSMGWETDYAFRVPCQAIKNPNAAVLGDTVLVFDLDNYVGRAMSKKDEVIIARKEAAANTEEQEDAKSYYYPPDEDEPQEIRDMEEKFQQAVEVNKKLFGTPAFQHNSGVRGLSAESSDEEWDMMVEARPLDITHTVDAGTVDDLLLEIMDDPPVLPQSQEAYPGEPIVIETTGEEE